MQKYILTEHPKSDSYQLKVLPILMMFGGVGELPYNY